jgi:hypothetical protein
MTAPYAGAPVTQTFRERWLNVERQIGDSAPVGLVEVRKGRLVHRQHPYPGLGYPTFGEYAGVLGIGFWYADWEVDGDWMTLDAVQNIKLEQDFTNNGIQTCTITMDNKVWTPTNSAAGYLYHIAQSGYYSPMRGFRGPKRPNAGISKTPFFNMLPNAQIRVKQGYGEDELVCTFLGLIDDVETDSSPNTVQITARDFGGVLVDEKFFGWAKEKILPSPLTFAPRGQAEGNRLVGGGAVASNTQAGLDPAFVVTPDEPFGWASQPVGTPDDTQWIEIHVPAGKYSQLYVRFPYDGMHTYIGIKPTAPPPPQGQSGITFAKFDGAEMSLTWDGWWNPNGVDVPGAEGGWPYFKEIKRTKSGKGYYISLGGEFETGDNTIIRMGFRNLVQTDQPIENGITFGATYQAAMTLFQVNLRWYKQDAVQGKYIILDDVCDIVRCVLRWAGFKAWEVEDSGVLPLSPIVCDDSKSFMDLIQLVSQQTGFNFFMGEVQDPEDPLDIGYPIFRNTRVLENRTGKTEFIDDRLLLTDAKVKVSNENDHCIIRCRGQAVNDGVGIDGDKVHRVMFAYIPSWAGEQAAKQAGVLKPLTHADQFYTTVDDCMFGCYLIAIQIALLKWTVILDLPCNPGIGLDTLQSVIERVQGLNSRVYVTNRSQEMQFGTSGYWTMELGGSLMDTPDMAGVIKDYDQAIARINRGGRNPWLRKRKGKTLQYGYQDK